MRYNVGEGKEYIVDKIKDERVDELGNREYLIS